MAINKQKPQILANLKEPIREMQPYIETSNTGHAQDAAKKAPMRANLTQLIGGEQTSDGAAAEASKKSMEKQTSDEEATAKQAASHPKP